MLIQELLTLLEAKPTVAFDLSKFTEILEQELGRGSVSVVEFTDDSVLSIEVVYDFSGDQIKISDLKKALKGWFTNIYQDRFGTTFTYNFVFGEKVSSTEQKKIIQAVKKVLDPYGNSK